MRSQQSNNSIREFYRDSKIFLTGATGFLGKAILEKLLRTCDSLDTVYVLMRPKRGVGIEQRLQELFQNPVFDRVRDQNPKLFQKIKPVPGDVSQPNLGLSQQDRDELIDNVNVVLHSAATVKFNESLKNAVILNTLGTKQVLDLCEGMKHLRSFVQVSTAYSNPDKMAVEEIVYELPYDPLKMIKLVQILPDECLETLTKKLLGKHPNTYTLTKAMAEQLVLERSSKIPAAMVRPSIVTGAWKEPYPGWINGIHGMTGLFMEIGRGTVKSVYCDDKCRFDMIPVDVVVNTVITAAWHTVAHPANSMRVYNCTSGSISPITYRQFKNYSEKYWREIPSKYVTWYPGLATRSNWSTHMVVSVVYQLIPSALLDGVMCCTGRKPIMLKMSRKILAATHDFQYFTTHDWDFRVETLFSLVKAVATAQDGDHFEMDISESNGFDWDCYMRNLVLGVRQYVLKDDLRSLPGAKVRLNRLFWFQKVCQALAFFALFKVILCNYYTLSNLGWYSNKSRSHFESTKNMVGTALIGGLLALGKGQAISGHQQ